MYIYYTGYVTTNQVNGKKYIGVHQTTNPNDNYLGSGTVLEKAIKKYGQTNFRKEVIAFMLNEEVMFDWEAENVTQEIVDDPMYYNCRTGGLGGYKHSKETRVNMSASAKKRPPISEKTHIKLKASRKNRPVPSAETRNKISIANKGRHRTDESRAKMSHSGKLRPPISDDTRAKLSALHKGKTSGMKGKHHSVETRAKMSIANKGKITDELRATVITVARNQITHY